jgi:murein DD-endopeptidase MepM/ murein hydrolase activator NlpD
MIGHSGWRWVGLVAAASAGMVLSADAKACATDPVSIAKGPSFIHPAPGKIEAGFGPRFHPLLNFIMQHNGMDYIANIGDPVHAAASGEVTSAGNQGEHGNAIEIRHGAGWVTFYAHLSRLAVRAGDCVKAGDLIGMSGNSGFSVGPHLHFEIRENGKYLDPAPLLDMMGRY